MIIWQSRSKTVFDFSKEEDELALIVYRNFFVTLEIAYANIGSIQSIYDCYRMAVYHWLDLLVRRESGVLLMIEDTFPQVRKNKVSFGNRNDAVLLVQHLFGSSIIWKFILFSRRLCGRVLWKFVILKVVYCWRRSNDKSWYDFWKKILEEY